MKKIGLVLSGGGARGAAHLGVLKALEELGIKISVISGVSAGAIIGALYAEGYTPTKILAEMKNISYFSITDILWGKDGLFSMGNLRKKLSGLIEANDFAHLAVTLFVTTTDIMNGQSVTFSEGKLIDLILGSCAVPAVYQPINYNDHLLVDGGLLNNLPVECLKESCDVIIGSHVNKIYDEAHPARLTTFSLLEKCFHLAIASSVYQRSLLCDVFIEPILSGYGMFDMKHADQIFEEGYKAAMESRQLLSAIC